MKTKNFCSLKDRRIKRMKRSHRQREKALQSIVQYLDSKTQILAIGETKK